MKTALWVLATIVACCPLVGMAQEARPPAGPPGFAEPAKEARSLPPWEEPSIDSRTALGKFARAAERGIFLVGNRVAIPGGSQAGIGTAWCISKKHRLLVTNAHVADMKHELKSELLAIPSGSSQRYKVEKYYYHPGVRRYLGGDQNLSVRAMDPKEGKVESASPDLAILQLSAEGPDLPFEFTLATDDELRLLFAQSVAMCGFPGHDNVGLWPASDTAKVAATFHDGVISRISNFNLDPDVPQAELLQLQYTMAGWGGYSGSPVFLSNGHVVAAHNMSRTEKRDNGATKTIAHGVRSDLVLDILVHHGLTDKVPFAIDKTQVDVERWTRPDEKSEKIRANVAQASRLVTEASRLSHQERFAEAGAKCNEAIKLVPSYMRAYYVRSSINVRYNGTVVDKLSFAERAKVLKQAVRDSEMARELVPSPENEMHIAMALNCLAQCLEDGTPLFRRVVETTTKLIDSGNVPAKARAYAHATRAFARYQLEMKEAALEDYDASVRIDPSEPAWLENRAHFLREALGRAAEADRDLAMAKEIRRTRVEKLGEELSK